MDLQEIEVFIDKNGQVQIQVHGVKGDACLDLTRDLEAALGGQVLSREMRPEALEGTETESLPDQIENRSGKKG